MAAMYAVQAVHPLLRKWWMRSRPCVANVTSDGIGATSEFYCPLWARPFEALYVLLFGSTKLLPAEPKVEPIAMEITVDTTDLKAALALLGQIAAEAKRANDALDVMRANGVSVVTR